MMHPKKFLPGFTQSDHAGSSAGGFDNTAITLLCNLSSVDAIWMSSKNSKNFPSLQLLILYTTLINVHCFGGQRASWATCRNSRLRWLQFCRCTLDLSKSDGRPSLETILLSLEKSWIRERESERGIKSSRDSCFQISMATRLSITKGFLAGNNL